MTASLLIFLSFFLFSCSAMEAAPIRKRVRIEEPTSISERETERSFSCRNERRFPLEPVRTFSLEEEVPTDLDENEEALSSAEEEGFLGENSVPALSVKPPLKRSRRMELPELNFENEIFLSQHGSMATALTELEEQKDTTDSIVY